MEDHRLLSDAEFERQFSRCVLNPSLFTHEAHLRLAWIYIRQFGQEQACITICDQLMRFTEHAGARDKFNKTVTVAAVKMMSHFISRSKATNVYELIKEFPRIKSDFKGLIASHYSADVFTSVLAKKQFVEPDRLPFA